MKKSREDEFWKEKAASDWNIKLYLLFSFDLNLQSRDKSFKIGSSCPRIFRSPSHMADRQL